MNKRERTSRSNSSGKRRDTAGKLVFLPHQIELELVGIIGPGDGLPDSDGIESVFLDGDECLLALVESLRQGAYAAPSFGPLCCADALSPRDRPLH